MHTYKSGSFKKYRNGTLFLLPFLAGLLLFYLLPFGIVIQKSFSTPCGVNFSNYQSLMQSASFQLAGWNTFRFIAIGAPLVMLLGLMLALLLFYKIKGKIASFFRSVFLYPMVVPVASAVMVVNVFFARSGIVNTLLTRIGLQSQEWINSEKVFYLLLGIFIWRNAGYLIVLYLSALYSVPELLFENAKVEGANYFQTFRYVIFPQLIPTFFFVLILSIMNAFNSFRDAYILGGTSPDPSIYMLQHFINNNFSNLNYERLSTAAIFVFLIIFVLVFALYQYVQRKNEDLA